MLYQEITEILIIPAPNFQIILLNLLYFQTNVIQNNSVKLRQPYSLPFKDIIPIWHCRMDLKQKNITMIYQILIHF